MRRYNQEIQAAWRGNKWLCVDDNTIALLYLRQCELLQRLAHRGHAAQNTLEIGDRSATTTPKGWSKNLGRMRQHPQWCSGSPGSADYAQVKTTVIEWILES